jgi:hypothetical protein
MREKESILNRPRKGEGKILQEQLLENMLLFIYWRRREKEKI